MRFRIFASGRKRQGSIGRAVEGRETCVGSHNAYHRAYYHNVIKKNPKQLKAKLLSGSFSRRKAKYGISRSEYEAMALNQKGLCAICKREPLESLRVDHDHSTGKIRALLCATCNAGLGQFHDDPEIIASAIEYLNKYREDKGK